MTGASSVIHVREELMMRRVRSSSVLFGLVGAVVLQAVPTTRAATVPFTETFSADAANWRDTTGAASVDWSASGGAGDSAFAHTSFNFVDSAANDTPILFRGQDEFGSSGGAFVGDWVTGGVTGFAASVRQDSGVPLNFFVRFAGPNNFPGANNVFFVPVPSGTWTDLFAPLPNASLIYEGPLTYGQVFGDIGHVQIGVSVPASLAGSDAALQFGLDNVSIVPDPATLGLLAIGGLAIAVRGRRRVRG